MKRILIVFTSLLMACEGQKQVSGDWCSQELRSGLSDYNEVKTSQSWFRVFAVGEGVYAIAEPYNYQEVISYLIVGSKGAVLFDSGMGMGRISDVVKELTSLPLTVLNSHSHYDHIGGNNEFNVVLAVDTPYTRHYAVHGWPHEAVRQEVTPTSFCAERLQGFDTASYAVKPYNDKIRGLLKDQEVLHLGNRLLEVIRVPGHTPDGIALLDRANGYLWTGDMFYEATIWLFFDGTDLDAYEASIARFAELAPSLNRVFPAHNTPVAEPERLIELQKAFASVRSGEAKGAEQSASNHPDDKKAVKFEFEHFSFLIRKDALK